MQDVILQFTFEAMKMWWGPAPNLRFFQPKITIQVKHNHILLSSKHISFFSVIFSAANQNQGVAYLQATTIVPTSKEFYFFSSCPTLVSTLYSLNCLFCTKCLSSSMSLFTVQTSKLIRNSEPEYLFLLSQY